MSRHQLMMWTSEGTFSDPLYTLQVSLSQLKNSVGVMEVDVKSPPAPSTPGPDRPKKLGLKSNTFTAHVQCFSPDFPCAEIWPNIKLGNGIWANFLLGNGIYTPLQDPLSKYLLLADLEGRTVNYGPSFFPSIYRPSANRAGRKSK